MHRTGLRDDGPFVGTVTFKGKKGEVALTLSGESCDMLLAVLADAAAQSVAEVADALRAQFIAPRTALLPSNQPPASTDAQQGK
jgi:hypothetical protein